MSAWTCRSTDGKAADKIVPPRLRIPYWKGLGAGVKMAQGVDVQIGRDRDDRYYRDRRRYDSDTTVGVGPGGVTIGPRQRCRMETTTIERDDGRRITRKERRCD